MKKTSLGLLALVIIFGLGSSALAATTATVKYKQASSATTKKYTAKVKSSAIQAALTAGDYSAWQTAVTEANPKSSLLTKINADNFSQYVEYTKLMKAGKYTEAKTIGQQLGIVKASSTTAKKTAVVKKAVVKKTMTKKTTATK